MNTKASVAYGWGVLIAAAGVSYYFAKKETNGRREEQTLRGERPTEILTWEERIARDPSPADGAVTAPPTISSLVKGHSGITSQLPPTSPDTGGKRVEVAIPSSG